jgi:hypothetical protein
MRKLGPLLEAATKSQLPDVKASCCTWGGVGVLEFPPQPAIKRAKDVMTTMKTGRNDFSSVGRKTSLDAIGNHSVTQRKLASNKKTGYGSNTRREFSIGHLARDRRRSGKAKTLPRMNTDQKEGFEFSPQRAQRSQRKKAPRFRSAFEFQLLFSVSPRLRGGC